MGFDMTLLNIGGGYPGRSVPNDKNTFKDILKWLTIISILFVQGSDLFYFHDHTDK